jgi:hypothetical protein
MTVDRYLTEASGPMRGLQSGPRPRTVAASSPMSPNNKKQQQHPAKIPTYGGTFQKPIPSSRHANISRPASSPMVSRSPHKEKHEEKQQQQQQPPPPIYENKMAPHLSLSAKRRSLLEVSASRSNASEMRFRESASMLSKPGWISGSQLAQSTLLYKDARAAGILAASSMSDIARLGSDAPLGWGSHAYRIGGENEHSADKRLTALAALKEQRAKKWWKNKD